MASFIILPFSLLHSETIPLVIHQANDAQLINFNGKNEGQVEITGKVLLTYGDLSIVADTVTLDLKTKDSNISGGVTLKQGSDVILGDSAYYNISKKTGTMFNASFAKDPWYCRGPKILMVKEKTIRIDSGTFSTCELPKPHYMMRAKKIMIYIDDKIEAYDAFLIFEVPFVGKLPLFYVPYFRRSIKDTKDNFVFKTGYSDVRGFFASIIYEYNFEKLFLGNDVKTAYIFDLLMTKHASSGIGFMLGYQNEFNYESYFKLPWRPDEYKDYKDMKAEVTYVKNFSYTPEMIEDTSPYEDTGTDYVPITDAHIADTTIPVDTELQVADGYTDTSYSDSGPRYIPLKKKPRYKIKDDAIIRNTKFHTELHFVPNKNLDYQLFQDKYFSDLYKMYNKTSLIEFTQDYIDNYHLSFYINKNINTDEKGVEKMPAIGFSKASSNISDSLGSIATYSYGFGLDNNHLWTDSAPLTMLRGTGSLNLNQQYKFFGWLGISASENYTQYYYRYNLINAGKFGKKNDLTRGTYSASMGPYTTIYGTFPKFNLLNVVGARHLIDPSLSLAYSSGTHKEMNPSSYYNFSGLEGTIGTSFGLNFSLGNRIQIKHLREYQIYEIDTSAIVDTSLIGTDTTTIPDSSVTGIAKTAPSPVKVDTSAAQDTSSLALFISDDTSLNDTVPMRQVTRIDTRILEPVSSNIGLSYDLIDFYPVNPRFNSISVFNTGNLLYRYDSISDTFAPRISPISGVLYITPLDMLKLDVNANYDLYTRLVNFNSGIGFNVSNIDLTFMKITGISIGMRYSSSFLDRVRLSNYVLISGNMGVAFLDYTASFTTSYDVLQRKFLGETISVKKDLHCWEANVDFVRWENSWEIRASINPKAFPSIKLPFSYNASTGFGTQILENYLP